MYLIGSLEPWNFMTFHILEITIPTDELHDFSEGLAQPLNIYNQIMIHLRENGIKFCDD